MKECSRSPIISYSDAKMHLVTWMRTSESRMAQEWHKIRENFRVTTPQYRLTLQSGYPGSQSRVTLFTNRRILLWNRSAAQQVDDVSTVDASSKLAFALIGNALGVLFFRKKNISSVRSCRHPLMTERFGCTSLEDEFYSAERWMNWSVMNSTIDSRYGVLASVQIVWFNHTTVPIKY